MRVEPDHTATGSAGAADAAHRSVAIAAKHQGEAPGLPRLGNAFSDLALCLENQAGIGFIVHPGFNLEKVNVGARCAAIRGKVLFKNSPRPKAAAPVPAARVERADDKFDSAHATSLSRNAPLRHGASGW